MATGNFKFNSVLRKRRIGQARLAALSFSAAASIYAAFTGAASAAVTNMPIAGITGWNQDLIAETPQSSSTTEPFDTQNGQTYFINGLIANGTNSAAFGNGVPLSGILNSATGVSTFQFQSYTANNALFLSPTSNANTTAEVGSSGLLTFANPVTTSSLSFLAASTNGAQIITYALNYTDGTVANGAFIAPDWFNGNPYAVNALGRTNARQVNSTGPVTIDTGQSNSSTGNPRLYEIDVPQLTLSANAGKYLSSITFSSPAVNSNATAIYAVSGVTGSSFTASPLLYTGAASANFDTSSVNFTGSSGATKFSNGMGPVTFDDTAGTNNPSLVVNDPFNGNEIQLTVQPQGVAPVGLVFNNSYGGPASIAYVISGGPIIGTGGLTITNSGTVELTNTNNYVGATNVSGGGYLQLDANASIASKAVIVGTGSEIFLEPGAQPVSAGNFGLTNNGTVQLNSISRTLSYLNGNGNLILAGVGTNVTVGGQLGYGSSYAGTISGVGNVTFGGALTLNGSSSFTGTATFGPNAAVLLGSPYALGATTNTMIFASNTASAYTIGGIGASAPLTASTGGALPYNYSLGIPSTGTPTATFGFSGTYPLELAGNATNWNTSGVTINAVAIPSAPLTLSGQIGVGGGGLTLTGVGTLILNNTTGTNAITGLTISGGAVQLNGPKETGTATAISVASGASLVINDNGGLAGKINGSGGSITITATLSGTGAPFALPDPVTGIVTAKEFGALRGVDGGIDTWGGNVTLGSATGISGGVGGTLTVSGNISGGSQIQFSANNTSNTILSGVNSGFTGESAIAGAHSKLTLGSFTAITASSDLNLDNSTTGTLGTTFDMAGYNASFGYLTTTAAITAGDTITNSGSTLSTLTLTNTATSGVFGGSIQETPAGKIALYFNSTGTQTLGLANNYSGGTTMNNSGTLLGGANTSFGSGTITISNNGFLGSNVSTGITIANPIVFNQTFGISLNVANPINLTTPITLASGITPFKTTGTDSNASHGVFSGTISGPGAANISGTVVFAGSNSYQGGTNLSSGILGITNDNALGTGPVKFLGGALAFEGYTSNLSFSNNGLIPPTLGAAFNGSTSTLNGVISTGAGNSSTGLLYVGPGVLVLNAANTYVGTTNISGGYLGFSAAADLPVGTINLIGGGIQLPAGIPVDLTAGGRVLNFTSAGGKLDTNGNNVTFTGSINNIGTGTFTKFGSGNLTLSKPLNVTTLLLQGGTVGSPSGLILNGSTITLNASSGIQIGEASNDNGLLSLDNGARVTSSGDVNIADQVSAGPTALPDNGTLLIADTGNLGTVFQTNNLYIGKGTGGSNVSGTVLQSGGILRIASSANNLYVGQNGIGLYNLSGGQVIAGAVTIAKTNISHGTFNLLGGNLTASSIGAGVTAYNAGDGAFFNFAGGSLTANASSATFFTGLTSVTIGAAGAPINVQGFSDTIGQNLSTGVVGGPDGGIIKTGTGTLTLSGNNSFTGPLNFSGGSVVGTTPTAFGTGAISLNNTVLTISSDPSSITFNGSSGLVINNYSSTSINVPNNYSPAFILGAIGNASFGGSITGSTAILFNGGTGTLTLTNSGNNYSGGTNLSTGTLMITSDAAIGTGPVVFGGGALGFSGYTSSMSIHNASGSSITPALAAPVGAITPFNGVISGNTGFRFVGPGTMLLTGANTYSGTTNVSGGFLSFASAANLPAGPILLTGGGIQYSSGVTTDLTSNGYSLNVSNGKIDTNGNNITFANPVIGTGTFYKLNSGTLTLSGTNAFASQYTQGGTVAAPSILSLNGSTSVITATGTVGIGEASGDNAIVMLDNGAKITASSSVNVGDLVATGTALPYNNAVLYIADTGSLGTIVNAPTAYIGYGQGGTNVTGTVNLTGGTFNSTGTVNLGYYGQGTFNLSAGRVAMSTLEMGVTATGPGIYNQLGGLTTESSTMYLGFATGGFGTVNLTAGNFNTSSTEYLGYQGTGIFNQSGGVHTTASSRFFGGTTAGYGIYNLTGGTDTVAGTMYVGYASGAGGGAYNISAGTFASSGSVVVGYQAGGVITQTGGTFYTPTLSMGYSGSSFSNATYNLLGGTLIIGSSIGQFSGAAATVFNFNGGTLQANGSSTSFFSGIRYVSIGASGAIINTNNNSDTVTETLYSGVSVGRDGGLTKNGIGLLTLGQSGGNSTYTGPTNINLGGIAAALVNGAMITNPFGAPGNTVNINAGGTIGLYNDSNTALFTTGSSLGYTFNYAVGSGYTFMNYNSSLAITTPFALGAASGTPSNFQGTIMGSGVLTYVGPGTMTIMSGDTNTGGTNIIGGTLAIPNDAALNNIAPTFTGSLGLLSINYSSGFVFSSGPVNLGVPAGAVGSLNSGLAGTAALTFGGPGMLVLNATGTNNGLTTITGGILNFSSGALGTGGLNLSGGILFYQTGATDDFTTGRSMNLTGNAQINTNGNNVLYGGNIGGLYLGSFTKNGSGGLTIQGTFTPTAVTIMGGSAAAPSILAFNGPGAVFSSNSTGAGFSVGEQTGDYGVLNVSNGASVTVAGGGFNVADQASAASSGSNNDTGIINLFGAGSTITSGGPVAVGKGNAANNASFGTINQGVGTTFQMNSGSTLTIGVNTQSTGLYNLSGGSALFGPISIASGTGSTGTFNLSGGTLQTSGITGGSGTSTFNFNGGTLLANSSSGTFIAGVTNLQILSSPAYINTNTFSPTITQVIKSGASSDGGLVKLGAGTLTLTGSNTYNGGTNVSAGTLAVSIPAALGTAGVTVYPGGKLAINSPVGFNTSTKPITLSGGALSLNGVTQSGSGFSGFSPFNLSLPGSTGFTPTNTGTTLNLTQSGVGGFAASTTLPYTVNDAGIFTMTFTYNHSTSGSFNAVADGISFGFEKQSATAIGGQGGSEGFSSGTGGTAVTPGEVGYFDIYGENYGLGNNGVLTSTSTNVNISTYSGETVTLIYNGPAKTFTSSILTPGGTFTSTATGIDLVSQMGGTAGGSISAWMFFAGSTGGVSATQNISNLAYSVSLPGATSISNPVSLTGSTTSNLQLGSATGLSASGIGALTFNPGSVLDVTNIGTSPTYSLTTAATVLSGAGTLDVTSGGTAFLGTLNDSTGTSTLTLQDAGTYVLTAPATSFVSGSSLNVSAGTALVVASPTALGTGSLNVFGTTTFPASNVSGGVYNYSSGPITINSGGFVKLNASSPQSTRILLTAGGLVINGTGSLDLANNEMDIQNGNLANLSAYAKAGYNAGAWNGSGIVSSAAAADGSHLTSIGVILNSADGGATQLYGNGTSLGTFDGANPGATDVLVKFTYYGDTNLDGAVDGTDYSQIDNTYLAENYSAGVPSNPISGWYYGDFNYDGVVDGSDYTLMDNTFNMQGGTLGTNPLAQIASEVSGTTGTSAVPEPATLSLLAVGSIALLGRRRRRI